MTEQCASEPLESPGCRVAVSLAWNVGVSDVERCRASSPILAFIRLRAPSSFQDKIRLRRSARIVEQAASKSVQQAARRAPLMLSVRRT